MSYYQFIIKYHNKFNSDKPVLTDNAEETESSSVPQTTSEATPISTVIASLLTQKQTPLVA
jgi:uncharacterized protein YozE (UPF0346 family)